VWIAEYQDIEIINNFLEIERSPVGVFDDIFFRFDSEFRGDTEAFEKALWQEYVQWFTTGAPKEYDIYQALKNDGLLKQDYTPDSRLEPTIQNLWQELLRFKSCIEGLEKNNFCIYFPPTRTDGAELGTWFTAVLKKKVPKGIRLVTIDYAAKRKVIISPAVPEILIKELRPQLQMLQAVSNEMDKGGGSSDTIGIDAQFRKQIRTVMNDTVKNDAGLLAKDVNVLLSLSRQMGTLSSAIAGLLIASQAYFTTKENSKSAQYAEEAIVKAEAAMAVNDPAGYPAWKSCMMIKGALLMGKKKRTEAIEAYDKLAETASTQGDVFFAMEGYRLSGHLHYELNKLNTAFETLLLALTAGSYLAQDVRRGSTFLHAAALALFIGKQIREEHDVKTLETELHAWLGDDWETLVQAEELKGVKVKQKTPFFQIG
jgi:tetratricopeptide (TPR) repeat protein